MELSIGVEEDMQPGESCTVYEQKVASWAKLSCSETLLCCFVDTLEIVQAYERYKKTFGDAVLAETHCQEGKREENFDGIQNLRTQRERRAQHLMERPKTYIPPSATTNKKSIGAMNTMLPMRKTTSAPQTPEVKVEPLPAKRLRKS